MTKNKECDQCGGSLLSTDELRSVNEDKRVGSKFECTDCGEELLIIEFGDEELARIAIPE